MTDRGSRLAALCALATVLTACGGSDTPVAPPAATTGAPADTGSGETGSSDAESAPPTSLPTTAPPAPAPSTSAPSTPAPPTTAVPVTDPPVTPPTAPPLDPTLVEFCFDSAQAYVAFALTGEIDEPTPEQARASIEFVVFTAETAAASAPPGYEAEPTRFAQLAGDIDALFARYDYDTEQLLANEDLDDHEPMLAEFDSIATDRLVPFMVEVCGIPLGVLHDQAVKLARVIDQAVTWPLVAVANQLGDIRMLVPTAWTDTIGSTEPEEVTSLQATTDIGAFETTWDVPGVRVRVFYVERGTAEPSLRVSQMPAASDCAPIGTQPYRDPVYTGELFLYQSCADTDTAAAVLAVTDTDRSTEVYLEFQFPGGIDRPLLDQMAAAFVAGI